MERLKNPELRRQVLLYGLGTLLFSGIMCFLDLRCAVLMLAAGVSFLAVFWHYVGKRYAAIETLSRMIDEILHGKTVLDIAGSEEGELSILSSEIQKLTVKLQQQADCLQGDKRRMSNAMADISHQLRTPLTSMHVTVSLLTRDDLSIEKRLTLTRELKNALSRMDWLIEALLKMSKIDAGTAAFRMTDISVKALLTKAAEPLLVPMELRQQTLEIAVGNETVTGDLLWCAEALGNLLKNCMEHTPVGGRVSVAVSETPVFTQIVISDTGDGFCPEDLPHLFERFYKGKNAAPNSIGIGLALARAVITAQNGTVTARNGKDGGAVFTVKFYKGIV